MASGLIHRPTSGVMLSTGYTTDRVCVASNKFHAVRELQKRAKYMDVILSGGFLSTDRPDRFNMTALQMDRFRHGLENGMRIVDSLADVAADLFLKAEAAGVTLPTADEVYARQRKYLETMDKMDLAWLCSLTGLAVTGYFRYNNQKMASDPQALEKLVAFRETVMRYGSYVLYAYVRGDSVMCAEVNRLVAGIFQEIVAWELGEEGIREGLHTIMMRTLKKRLVADAEGKNGPDEDESPNQEGDVEDDYFSVQDCVAQALEKVIYKALTVAE